MRVVSGQGSAPGCPAWAPRAGRVRLLGEGISAGCYQRRWGRVASVKCASIRRSHASRSIRLKSPLQV